MVTVRYREVKLTRKVRVACAGGCGKRLARQQTFWQTLNPFNTNAEGQPKTGPEIYAELKVLADVWQPVATCPACVAAPSYRCTFTDGGRIGRTHGVEPPLDNRPVVDVPTPAAAGTVCPLCCLANCPLPGACQ